MKTFLMIGAGLFLLLILLLLVFAVIAVFDMTLDALFDTSLSEVIYDLRERSNGRGK